MLVVDRWPPIYDAEELKGTIKKLSTSHELTKHFYTVPVGRNAFQGDIIELKSALPLIWKDGKPGIKQDIERWMVIGNTCDIDRSLDDVTYTQVIPIAQVVNEDVKASDRQLFLTYGYFRRFYLPPWDETIAEEIYFADFTRPVTIHKEALAQHATRITSMTFDSWLLLHSCLVRFLARDDGRND